jgi:hypothetical protein
MEQDHAGTLIAATAPLHITEVRLAHGWWNGLFLGTAPTG